MQKIEIIVPDGCEVQIVRKEEKKEPVIRTYQDLIDNKINLNGYFITGSCEIEPYNILAQRGFSEEVAASEKVAKSMLAMAMISQLMPYYGGAITDEEWRDCDVTKHCLFRKENYMATTLSKSFHYFLAFHTLEQRDEFLKYNNQLVKDYLMID